VGSVVGRPNVCVVRVGKCSRNTLHLSKLICTDEIDACVRI
jgi:hypothetical protein